LIAVLGGQEKKDEFGKGFIPSKVHIMEIGDEMV